MSLRIKLLQLREQCRRENFLLVFGREFRKVLYKYEEWVPVEKELEGLRDLPDPEGGPFSFIEFGPENVDSQSIVFPISSRIEKATNYFRQGYRMIAMVRDGQVVGDIWYVCRKMNSLPACHPHLGRFGIYLEDDEVYMFDMFVHDEQRGGGLATYFHCKALQLLRDRGFRKNYGCFDPSYTPAMWMHRILGYRELPRYELRRFFYLYETLRVKG
jgi:GNAT superfamily N-acetyltransferase